MNLVSWVGETTTLALYYIPPFTYNATKMQSIDTSLEWVPAKNVPIKPSNLPDVPPLGVVL